MLRALRVFRVPRTFARKCTLRRTTHIRAKIIGERTPGVALTADFVKLPNRATFLYPNTQTITADGTVLEGHGVVPDTGKSHLRETIHSLLLSFLVLS